jgi:hypothetical protein
MSLTMRWTDVVGWIESRVSQYQSSNDVLGPQNYAQVLGTGPEPLTPFPRWANLTSLTTNHIIPIDLITSSVSVEMKPQLRENRQKMKTALSWRYVLFLRSPVQRTTTTPFQDTESRLSTLRARAGITPSPSPPHKPDAVDAASVASGSGVTLNNGHINLFADLEQHTAALAARASKSKPAMTDSDRGVPLAPTKQDLHPWYSVTRSSGKDDKTAEARR